MRLVFFFFWWDYAPEHVWTGSDRWRGKSARNARSLSRIRPSLDGRSRKTCFREPCKTKMQRLLDWRSTIEFCVKLGKTAAKTFEIIERAYREDSLAGSGVFRWYETFLEGRQELADEARAGGWPSTSSSNDIVRRVRELLNADHQMVVRLVVQTLGVLKSIVHENTTKDLQTRKHRRRLEVASLQRHSPHRPPHDQLKQGFRRFPSFPTVWTWLPPTFFCFHALKDSWKDGISGQLEESERLAPQL